MAKTLKNLTGVIWRPQGDGRWYPVYRWKSLYFQGEPRLYKAFKEGEREAALRYLSNRIAGFLFGVCPMIVTDNKEGPVSIESNPEWDALPCLTSDEEGLPCMTDGSELPEDD